MSKTVKYIIVVIILLIGNLALVFTDGLQRSASFDDELFVIENINEISSVVISKDGEKIELTKESANWKLNNAFEADQNFLQVLFSILNQVKVKRVVGALEQPISRNVAIEFSSGEVATFDFTSDALGTSSYFIQDGSTYQVEVPGYRDNVVNIFQLTEDQWKSRIVFDGSWRTIQRLNLTSKSKELTISFVNQFFEVDGVSAIDSSGVVDYLNQFQLFQANEMISRGRFPDLDSLMNTTPSAILTIDDIQNDAATTFSIYPNLTGQTYQLVTKNNEVMMVFDRRRIQSLLKFNEDFRAN
ncbi:MAG: hypothetical protein ABJG78_13440 [Cyclobacteriaceae bacterium]